jgi:hypothetical protein
MISYINSAEECVFTKAVAGEATPEDAIKEA